MFDFHLNIIVLIPALLMVLSMLLLFALFLPRLYRIRRKVTADNIAEMPSDEAYPPVSVIVYSHGDAYNLRTLLPSILEQDYPAPIEVIVANDESADDTADVVSVLQMHHTNLYQTYAPKHSRNLSRKKLTITLGVKAAQYETLLLTSGHCRIESRMWLRKMMRHVAEGRSVVVGYSAPVAYDGAKMPLSRAFDLVWDAARWLSRAIRRSPYMGMGENLVYTRSDFFAHNGFSQTLNLKFGDDDIFVNEIATDTNSAVELSDDAQLVTLETAPAALHEINRLRRAFTAGYLPRRPYLIMSGVVWCWWLMLLSGIATALLGLPSLIPAIGAMVLFIVAWLVVSINVGRTCRALHLRRVRFMAPLLLLWHPFYGLKYRLRARASRQENFTWGLY